MNEINKFWMPDRRNMFANEKCTIKSRRLIDKSVGVRARHINCCDHRWGAHTSAASTRTNERVHLVFVLQTLCAHHVHFGVCCVLSAQATAPQHNNNWIILYTSIWRYMGEHASAARSLAFAIMIHEWMPKVCRGWWNSRAQKDQCICILECVGITAHSAGTYATPKTNEFHENSMNLFVFDRNYDDNYMGAPMHDVSIHDHNAALLFFVLFELSVWTDWKMTHRNNLACAHSSN